MQRIILCAFAVAFLITASFSVMAQFGGGNGSAANPYQIKTKKHLENLADSVNTSTNDTNNWSKNKYFVLMNNITDSVRTVIGEHPKGFQGNFDGKNFKITLAIDKTLSYGSGLFGMIGSSYNESDTITYHIKNIVVDGYVNSSSYGGGIVGFVNCYSRTCIITNCINIAKINAYTSGGIVGAFCVYSNPNMVSKCINLGNVNGMYSVGGIVGISGCYKFNISNCINSAYIKGTNRVGGIIGHNYGNHCIIENSINTGVVEGETGKIRGISGND